MADDLSRENILEGRKRSKHLIFQLGEESYGIPLSSVKEVIGITEITPVPHVPDFFKGFINLRGRIISIIDLRIKLALKPTDYKPKKTSIVISEVQDLTIGAIVDDVREVANFENAQIEEHVNIQSEISRDFITGVAKTDDKHLILLLDIAEVLSVEDIEILKTKEQQE